MKTFLVGVCLAALVAGARPAEADVNLFAASGTLRACGCTYYPASHDWICQTVLEFDGPTPHYSPTRPSVVPVELIEQAIGQCGTWTLPRKVQALYFLAPAGLDYVHGLVRTPIQIYYLVDQGPAAAASCEGFSYVCGHQLPFPGCGSYAPTAAEEPCFQAAAASGTVTACGLGYCGVP